MKRFKPSHSGYVRLWLGCTLAFLLPFLIRQYSGTVWPWLLGTVVIGYGVYVQVLYDKERAAWRERTGKLR